MFPEILSPRFAYQVTDDQRLKSNHLSEKRIEALRDSLFPLTEFFYDQHKEKLRIWSIPNCKVIGILEKSDGKVLYFHKVRNGLLLEDDSTTIHNKLLSAPDSCKWQGVTQDDGILIIFPLLIAAGWKTAIPRSQTDLSGLNRLARGKTQEQVCSWFYTNGYQVKGQSTVRIEIHMRNAGSAGTYPAHDHQTIQNMLRQGGYIAKVHYPNPSAAESQDKFAGRGVVFHHPKDKSQTTFNVDFTRVKNHGGAWDAEKEGGYHIDVKNPKFSAKVKISTRETYDANYKARQEGKPTPYELKASVKQFHETLAKTGLTKSYNSCHPDSPAPKGGGGGQIGGVGCSVELIEGLFDSPEALFETHHSFFIPAFEGNDVPFTSQEMHQILHELARGIFVHNTVPFFSLHFNQNAFLYPVIHPAYENTLVGQIFSMLDYFMKGDLNGGVFTESFIQQWAKDPVKIEVTESLLQQLINFKSYAETHLKGSDKVYQSVRELIKIGELSALAKLEKAMGERAEQMLDNKTLPESPIFKDYTKFNNSFRIISKQTGIHKAGTLLKLAPDFDVEYTVEPHPDYQQALEEFYKVNGHYPDAYAFLLEAYDLMKKQIHDQMVKMPFCRSYFALLGVINFFCYYFRTLQKHNKIPILPEVELQPAKSPALFPPLPILTVRKEEIKINLFNILKELLRDHHSFLVKYSLNQTHADENTKMNETLRQLIRNEIFRNASAPMQRQLSKNSTLCSEFIEHFITEFNPFEQIKSSLEEIPKEQRANKIKYVNFSDELNKLISLGFRHLDLFVLPSEQTPEELELGRKIVGGCGMRVSPMEIQYSSEANDLLNQSWSKIQTTPYGEFLPITSADPTAPKGVLFTLSFMDIPSGSNHPANIESLLFSSNRKNHITQMYALISLMSQELRKDFTELLNQAERPEQFVDPDQRSLLHYSAMSEDPYFTSELLKKGASLLARDSKAYLPIHYAAMEGKISQLELLLKQEKQTLRTQSNQGATPLIVAIQHNQYLAAEFLIDAGAEGNEQLSDGYTALHCAIHYGHEKTIRLILEKTPKAISTINTLNREGISPLMIACRLELTSVVDYLLSKGADPTLKSSDGTTALEIAVKKNHLAICKLLVSRSPLTPTTIETAIKKSSLEINQELSRLKGYISYVNSIGDTPLLMAIRYANIPIARIILNLVDSASLNVKNRLNETAIILAAKGKFYSLLGELLTKGAQISPLDLFSLLIKTGYQGQDSTLNAKINIQLTQNQLQQLALIAAQASNHTAISTLLLPLNLDLSNIVGECGWKIEHYLAKSDGIYLLRMRLQNSQDLLKPLAQDGGKTLPYIAGERGSCRVLDYLLSRMKSSNVSLANHYQGRGLIYSVLERGELAGLRLLIEKAEDPQLLNRAMDNSGSLPVHLAVQKGTLEVIEFMFNQGANFQVRDQQGHYPLYHAILRQDEILINFFLDDRHSNPITADSIYAAASIDDGVIFNLLLTHGMNLNDCQNPNEDSALLMAIKTHDLKAALKLIQHGASVTQPNRNRWTPFLLASAMGEMEIMQLILDKHPLSKQDIINGNNALHLACEQGHEHCVQVLVENGLSPQTPNSQDQTPQRLANGNLAVEASLNFPPAIQKYKKYVDLLDKMIQNQDLSTILASLPNFPLNCYFTIYRNGYRFRGTLLHIALHLCAKCEGIELLISTIASNRQTNFDLRDSQGNSYAHLMAAEGIDPTPFNVFDLRTVNCNKETPLHLASKENHTLLLANLIRKLQTSDLNMSDKEGRTPLFHAIQANKLKNLALLLKAGADLEQCDIQGITPLILACALSNYPGIRKLIKRGADVNRIRRVAKEEITPLSLSMQSPHEDISLLLLFNGAKLSSSSMRSLSIGHLAAGKGKIYILRFLAEQGSSLSSINSEGFQPIHTAALTGKVKALDFLVSQGIPVDSPIIGSTTSKGQIELQKGATPLLIAPMHGTIEAVKWLIDHGANPELETQSGLSVLRSALDNIPLKVIEMLNFFKEYLFGQNLKQLLPAIEKAIARDYVEPLKLLYQTGVSIPSKVKSSYTGLHLACLYGSLKVTEFLLSQKADPKILSDSGELAIELSAANESASQFELMLRYTEQQAINRQNSRGETLTHIATRKGNLTHVMLLMDLGADFDKQDSQGQTPLHIAAEKGFTDLVTLLMIAGANPDVETFFNLRKPEQFGNQSIRDLIAKIRLCKQQAPLGCTPLHLATRIGHLLSVKLMARNLDVNQKNDLGRTALHDAVSGGSLEIIRELIDQGIDPAEKDLQKKTALAIAESESPNPLIAKFLREIS